jgi:hypothetical protein
MKDLQSLGRDRPVYTFLGGHLAFLGLDPKYYRKTHNKISEELIVALPE